jgi:hypothetical protein
LAPVRTHWPLFVLAAACSYSPLLVRAHLHSFAGPRSSLLVYLRSVLLVRLAPRSCLSPVFCWSPFPTHLSPFGCTGWPSCSLLLVCALRRSFVLVAVHLLVPVCPVCVCSVVLVLAICFRLCSLVFVWVCLSSFSFCSHLFGLCRACLCFDGVLLGSQASRLCLHQMYVSR